MKKDFMAVILGCDENTYGFARTFHSKYRIKPIALSTNILEVCKNSKILDIIIDEKLHRLEHFIEVLEDFGKRLKKEYEKIILIPCSDIYIDLPYPKTIIVNEKNYKEKVKSIDFDYPLILKPNNSNSEEYLSASFDGKEKVFFINDEETLLSKIKAVYSSSYSGEMLIQKFVSGDDTNMRVFNVYSDRNGKVRVMSLGQPILEEYHPKTYGNYAAIISLEGVCEIMEKIKDFLEKIGFTGAANFDIKMDELTKEYYIFEINPRPGRSSYYSTFGGASIQEAYVEDLVYDRLEDKFGNEKEVLWLNVPMYLLNKYVTKDEIKKKVRTLKSKKEVYHTLKYKGNNQHQ